MFTTEITSDLPASLDDVWDEVNTLKAVNRELAPLLRMTAPKDKYCFPFNQAPLRQTLFASWLLLFGVLPFDRHLIQFDEVWQGGFRENSKSAIHRFWRHKRILSPTDNGCKVTDFVEFEPRLPLLGHFMVHVVRLVFWNRHKYLRRHFGAQRA